MSTRHPSLLRKAISVLASFALVFAFVPTAWAGTGEGPTQKQDGYLYLDCAQTGGSGTVSIKADNAEEYALVEGNSVSLLSVSSSFSILFSPDASSTFDTVRGAVLRFEGAGNDGLRGVLNPGENGSYTASFDLSSYKNGSWSISSTSFELEFGWGKIDETGNSGQPPQQVSTTEILLDNNNGIYDDSYKSSYGTIFYSTNYTESSSTDATWTELNNNLASGKSYVIPNANITIKVIYSEAAKANKLGAYCPNGPSFDDGAPVHFSGGHIEFQEGGNNGGGGPEPFKYYERFFQTNPYATQGNQTVTAKVTLIGEADFAINDSGEFGFVEDLANQPSAQKNFDVEFHVGENTGTVDFFFSIMFNQKYKSIKINGTEYVTQLPTSREELLKAFYRQKNYYKITGVTKADNYTIEVTRVDAAP